MSGTPIQVAVNLALRSPAIRLSSLLSVFFSCVLFSFLVVNFLFSPVAFFCTFYLLCNLVFKSGALLGVKSKVSIMKTRLLKYNDCFSTIQGTFSDKTF